MAKDSKGHGSDKRGGGLTPVQSENAPFVSRLGKAAGHSYLDPHDPRGDNDLGFMHTSNLNDAGAAQELAGGHPKSGAAPVHAGAAGRKDKPYVSGSRRTPMKPGWA